MSSRLLLVLSVVVLLPSIVFAGEKLPKPTRQPAAPTANQKSLQAQGTALHDAGKFDEAIAKYKQILDESPDEVNALYETAFSYEGKMDCETAIRYARRGAEYRSDVLPHFHLVLGNCLDDLGRKADALDLYKQAIKLNPGFALMHFNLGVALTGTNQFEEAKKSLQQSLLLDPSHASSHLVLAQVYDQLGYRVPSILALSRFIALEPQSQRGRNMIPVLQKLIGSDVSAGNKPGEINITLALPSKGKTDEGDFESVALGLSIGVAAAQIKEAEIITPFKRFATIYAIMGEGLSRTKGKGFAVRYYAPFFAEMDSKGLVEPFVYQTFQGLNLEGADTWKKENETKFTSFRAWAATYNWPTAAK